ncbi:hypothetical protein JTE90_018976 [Oedothorax gibbosus]|uniref:Uncharacterized protein n=1 Tax=Oedothorax gibbosus TaxID=931172 RepID=A0AAV6UZG2_9ARAC|nr:hypothetical protein JTE90_018976 [Oedothorax gibbosus]
MSRTKCDSAISSGPWCQDDYRNSVQFRGKQVFTAASVEDTWSQKLDTNSVDPKLNKYSLVIVFPSVTSNNEKDNTSDGSVAMNSNVVDSGIGSISPSPPKTPTPDYDSLEDSCEINLKPNSQGMTTPKKVHFSIITDSAADVTPKAKPSWRDMLVCQPLDYQDDPAHCYRQDWVKGETKTRGRSRHRNTMLHQHLSTTILHDLEQISERASRSEMKRAKSSTKLVRRASSLDRFAELRYSHRSPVGCDPDPLKDPISKKRSNKKTRSPKTSER